MKDNNIVAIIGWVVLAAGLLFYLFGIVMAIFFPTTITENGQEIKKIPEFLETTTTSIGAMLLTNLGVLLGYAMAKQDTSTAMILMAPWKIFIPGPMDMREKIQDIPAIIYVISLLACCSCWIIKTIKGEPVVSIVSMFSKTFIGVITAYMGFLLGIKEK